MKKAFKVLGIILLSVIIILIGIYTWVSYSLSNVFEETYSKKDLIENLKNKRPEILSIKEYINSITPREKEVSIEFEDNKITIFHVENSDGYKSSNWYLKNNSKKVDSLNSSLNWNQMTLKTLKTKLNKANCISIESGNPTTIGFQRSGMGMYFYKVFDKDLTKNQIKKYNDSCQYIFYEKNIVLEYGGGAIGRQCFEDFYKKDSIN